MSGFLTPPAQVAFRHRDARDGCEVAFFQTAESGVLVEGQTVAVEAGTAWSVGYAIALDPHWLTLRAHVQGRSRAGDRSVTLAADGSGRWEVDGAARPELDGCLDVDLESSALTNAFPVRRLGLAVGEAATVPAAWVRADGLAVERLEQRYRRLPDADGLRCYEYAAPELDFSCRLEYDEHAIIRDYPGLATRLA
jgi:uncharacterized protein